MPIFPFFVLRLTLGNLKLYQVYARIMAIIGDIPQDSKSMSGAVHTLKTMIIKSNDGHEELARHLTSSFELNTKQNFGEKLLDFFAKYAPNELSAIGLNSIVFRDTIGNKLCEMILQTKSNSDLL